MAWLAVDKNGDELIFDGEPSREICETKEQWIMLHTDVNNFVALPTGTIEKIIGRKLTWADEPVEIL